MEIQDQRRSGENGEQNRREGGNSGTDDINSTILQYRNRQFSNVGTMRHENWVLTLSNREQARSHYRIQRKFMDGNLSLVHTEWDTFTVVVVPFSLGGGTP